MSVDLMDPYSNFDEYFTALISPVSDNTKRQEIPSNIQDKQKLMDEKKFNLIQKVEPQNLLMPNVPLGNMIQNGVIAIVPLNINHNMLTNSNNNVATNNLIKPINNPPTSNTKKTTKKRKNLAETSKNVVTTITEVTSNEEEIDELGKLQDETYEPESPNKKTKKNGKATKKKKETPKRKRVNYCFEIHRSGCQANKDSKLYCKVFLKGKLQSEVDLIKGARGKWAYTFYDQRKKKKERRYWPSQSSGPVIEDPCNCDKCAPNGIQIVPNNNTNMVLIKNHHGNNEEEYSSPSTEEDENQNNNSNTPISQHQMQQIQLIRQQQSEYQAVGFPQYIDSQPTPQVVYYMPHNVVYPYHNDVISQQQETLYQQQQQHLQQYNMKMEQKNLVNLKSSNDFQNNHYLKSSNDFVNNHQRPWDTYFPVGTSLGSSLGSSMGSSSNNMEYNNDGFFVDSLQNNFL